MKDFALDWGERLLIVLLFVAFAFSNIRSGDYWNFILVALEAISVIFILTRRRAISISEAPLDWALALAGTLAPLLIRPGGEPLVGPLASVLIVAGALISFAAKASLNRRYGVAPANRGVQDSLAYGLVRHPMYLGYMIAQVGYLLHNPTLYNLCIYAAAWGLQVGRIIREETLLRMDPAYQAYSDRVKYRLLPGLF